jgi:hypothetical protein
MVESNTIPFLKETKAVTNWQMKKASDCAVAQWDAFVLMSIIQTAIGSVMISAMQQSCHKLAGTSIAYAISYIKLISVATGASPP